jgi:hypothetical protein
MTGQTMTLAASAVPTVAFNYDLVTEDFQGTLIATAERIKSRVRRQTADIIAIGHDLLAIKADLEHGLFLKWVTAEFNWSARTAQNYMAAAEWAGAKYETVSHLPPKLIYDLTSKSTPAEIKAEVRAELDAGRSVDVQSIKGKIEDARWQQRQSESQAPKRRRKPVSDATRRRHEREEAKRQDEVERRDAERKAGATEIVAILRKLPEPDFERLLELLNTSSLWTVQDMLNRGRA